MNTKTKLSPDSHQNITVQILCISKLEALQSELLQEKKKLKNGAEKRK